MIPVIKMELYHIADVVIFIKAISYKRTLGISIIPTNAVSLDFNTQHVIFLRAER